MKSTRRPMQVSSEAHSLASKISNQYGVSIAAAVEYALRMVARMNPEEITFPKKSWWKKCNRRTAFVAEERAT